MINNFAEPCEIAYLTIFYSLKENGEQPKTLAKSIICLIEIMRYNMSKIINLEEIEEKCCKCGHFAIRIFTTYQNGSFASCLKCLNCEIQDMSVSLCL